MKEFYGLQLAAVTLWWILIYRISKKPLYDATNGTVCTRPSYLPVDWLLAVQKYRRAIFVGFPCSLVVGALYGEHLVVRIFVAVVASFYHLAESSVTCRHGEFPVLYNAIAMVLPRDLAHAVSLGISIHFIFCTGVSKVLHGGFHWVQSDTMRTYLQLYGESSSGKPLLPELNILVRKWSILTSSIGFATIFMECIFLPGLLFAPGEFRVLGFLAMIGLHIGIAVLMSLKVGVVFLTTIPCYYIGYSCTASIGSIEWIVAFGVGFLPSLWELTTKTMLPENWPISPLPLFMWSGDQAEWIASLMMKGNTRIVISTDVIEVGLKVIPHGVAVDTDEKVVHDIILRAVSFTLVHPILIKPIIERDVDQLISALRIWLNQNERLVEVRTGLYLRKASLVRIDGKGMIVEVMDTKKSK